MGGTRDHLQRWMLGGLVAALVGLAAVPAIAQQTPRESYERGETLGPRAIDDDSPFRTFLPQSFRVTFEDLLVRLDKEDRLVIEFEVESGTWERLQEDEIRLWLEIWIPLEAGYSFFAYPRLRDIRLITRREGTIRFPFWIDVDPNNQVAFCPMGRTVVDDPKEIIGWTCETTKGYRPRSAWGPQISTGTTFLLRREWGPLGVGQWYWINPYGLFRFSRPLPQVAPPQLPGRSPHDGITFPPGRRP